MTHRSTPSASEWLCAQLIDGKTRNGHCRMDLRVPAYLHVLFMLPHGCIRAVVKNISFEGAHLDLDPASGQQTLGAMGSLCFEPAGPAIDMPVVIIWHQGTGVGVRFGAYNTNTERYLTHVVAQQLSRYRSPRKAATPDCREYATRNPASVVAASLMPAVRSSA